MGEPLLGEEILKDIYDLYRKGLLREQLRRVLARSSEEWVSDLDGYRFRTCVDDKKYHQTGAK